MMRPTCSAAPSDAVAITALDVSTGSVCRKPPMLCCRATLMSAPPWGRPVYRLTARVEKLRVRALPAHVVDDVDRLAAPHGEVVLGDRPHDRLVERVRAHQGRGGRV